MAKLTSSLCSMATVGMKSIYRMSDAPPNWAQDDPTQPDYIANKNEAEKLRPIYVNGEQMLDDTHESGPLNLVGGHNVDLAVDGNNLIISAKGSGGEGPGGGCDCPEVVEGEGIDIVETPYGQKIVSLEKGSITDEYIDYVSMSKLVQSENDIFILNGGNAHGEYN
jgi:hypothetical protein